MRFSARQRSEYGDSKWGCLVALLVIGVLVAVLDAWLHEPILDWWEGNGDLKVWINPNARVYYCPGEMEYGNTEPGFFTTQLQARFDGYRSSRSWNVGCGTAARATRTLHSALIGRVKGRANWYSSGLFTTSIKNETDWDLTEVRVWVSRRDGKKESKTFLCLIGPQAETTITGTLDLQHEPPDSEWQWNIAKIRGHPPH
jgi:hypothetical protein